MIRFLPALLSLLLVHGFLFSQDHVIRLSASDNMAGAAGPVIDFTKTIIHHPAHNIEMYTGKPGFFCFII
jgi:hypothetical protein